MNKITIAGHLGADPETRFTSTGKKVTTIRVATRTRKGTQEDTIWWRVTLWDDRFEKMMPHFKKGSPIIVYGDFHKPEIYQDREGKSHVSTELTAIDIQFSPFGKPDQRPGDLTSSTAFGSPQEASSTPPFSPMMNNELSNAPSTASHSFDDEVPF